MFILDFLLKERLRGTNIAAPDVCDTPILAFKFARVGDAYIGGLRARERLHREVGGIGNWPDG
jgi:hypothetical protein